MIPPWFSMVFERFSQALDWLSSRLSVERQLARRVHFARAGFLTATSVSPISHTHPCQLCGTVSVRCISLMGYDTNNFMTLIDSRSGVGW